jgi:hypothetical protein
MGAMRLRLGSLITATALAVTYVAAIGTTARAEDELPACAAEGCWTAPFSPFGLFDAAPPKTIDDSKKFPAGSSAVVLPSGRILYWNGLQDLEGASFPLPTDAGRIDPHSKTSILDLTGSAPAFYPDAKAPVGDDLFCSDQRLNQNGTVVVTGGTHWTNEVANPADDGTGPGGLAELYGSDDTHLFTAGTEKLGNLEGDITTSQWSLGKDMEKGRWYPTEVTLADGREFVAGGVGKLLWNSSLLDDVDTDEGTDYDEATNPAPQNVLETEIYNADTDTWKTNAPVDNITLPLFARMHLLPNGELFFGGVGQMWGPAGQSVDQLEWNNYKLLNTHAIGAESDAGWRTAGMGNFGARSGAFSQMLPIKAPFNQVDVLVGGGVLGTSPGTELGTKITEIVHLTKDEAGQFQASAEQVEDMNAARWYSSAVTLPNGQVVAVNGADKDEVVMPGTEDAVRTTELWTGTQWLKLADSGRERTYHNSALLLPDGSVLVGGHAPINRYYGPNGATNDETAALTGENLVSNNFKDPSFERLFPPYLWGDGGDRPKLLSAQKHATWGELLKFQEDPANTDPIHSVVLTRLPSVTHITDADARTIELGAPTTGTGQSRFIQIPDNKDVVPPGFYYLFAMSENGVPSEAVVIQVSDTEHQVGAGDATPIHLAPQAFRTAGSSDITSVKAPATAAADTAAAVGSTADVAVTTEHGSAMPISGHDSSSVPAGLLAGFAALGGVTLVRRVRLGARERA